MSLVLRPARAFGSWGLSPQGIHAAGCCFVAPVRIRKQTVLSAPASVKAGAVTREPKGRVKPTNSAKSDTYTSMLLLGRDGVPLGGIWGGRSWMVGFFLGGDGRQPFPFWRVQAVVSDLATIRGRPGFRTLRHLSCGWHGNQSR